MIDNLLTPKDIENRIFRKSSFGGYVVADVDEFLDQICEDMEIYTARIADLEQKNGQLEVKIKEYEEIKDSIQETLFAAQRAAKQIVLESQRSIAESESEAENIIADAREEAQRIIKESEEVLKQSQAERERILEEADLDAKEIRNSISAIKRERAALVETSEALVRDFQNLIDRNREILEAEERFPVVVVEH